jgi:hypothetical protein
MNAPQRRPRRSLKYSSRWLAAAVGAGAPLCLIACGFVACSRASMSPRPISATPKYAAFSVPLSRDPVYLRQATAPDFWALAPYYVGQQDDTSCSLASLTMLVNAARHDTHLSTDEPLVTQPVLRQRVASSVWERGLAPGGDGVTLDQLALLARQSLLAFGVEPVAVRTTHVPAPSPEALEQLRAALRASEDSDSDFVLVNFLAGAYVGVGEYGHIAPVGAYDGERRRVLILDPDRTWYEPYWVPDEVALAGMATRDPVASQPRGYLYVSLRSKSDRAPAGD